jgi:CheY-like chemotaxis protein
VATTVLAVDDSVTMRKVLEITFAGSDYHVVTASSGNEAVAAVSQHRPAIVLLDATLDPDGYEVCKQIKAASPGTPVVILSSKQNPFNAASGSAAGADDHIDKPYDTQQVLDKVGKIIAGGGARPAAAAAAPAPAAARPAAAAPAAAAPAAAAASAPRGKTLLYSAEQVPPAVQAARGAAAAPAPAAGPPAAAPAPAAARPAAAAAAQPAIAAAVNGQIQQRLGDMNLSPQQVDAIAALSREIVERVVWEVVPVLAETIIKEEIARLTK